MEPVRLCLEPDEDVEERCSSARFVARGHHQAEHASANTGPGQQHCHSQPGCTCEQLGDQPAAGLHDARLWRRHGSSQRDGRLSDHAQRQRLSDATSHQLRHAESAWPGCARCGLRCRSIQHGHASRWHGSLSADVHRFCSARLSTAEPVSSSRWLPNAATSAGRISTAGLSSPALSTAATTDLCRSGSTGRPVGRLQHAL